MLTNDASDIKSVCPFITEDIVHERQRLQLCAVHTVNNLLQMSHGQYNQETSNNNGSFILCSGRVYKRHLQHTYPASKQEFDEIADELGHQEMVLLSQESNRLIWPRSSFTNNHRSLFTGNYSYEVIEVALQRRGVTLERCHSDMPLLHSEEGVCLGYIIHSLSSKRSALSIRSLLGRMFTAGHHWYCISRLHRMQQRTDSKWENSDWLMTKDESEIWYIIDSCVDQVTYLNSNDELINFLKHTRNDGSDVFRAVSKLEPLS